MGKLYSRFFDIQTILKHPWASDSAFGSSVVLLAKLCFRVCTFQRVNQLILRRSVRRICMGFCIDACPVEPGDDPGQRRFRIEPFTNGKRC